MLCCELPAFLPQCHPLCVSSMPNQSGSPMRALHHIIGVLLPASMRVNLLPLRMPTPASALYAVLPINLLGTRDAHIWNGASGDVAFQRLTISSLARGSNLYWCVPLWWRSGALHCCFLTDTVGMAPRTVGACFGRPLAGPKLPPCCARADAWHAPQGSLLLRLHRDRLHLLAADQVLPGAAFQTSCLQAGWARQRSAVM